VAPGPGSEVAPLMSPLCDAGTQNVEASVAVAGVPMVIGPAGLPISRIKRQACEFGSVKQPACAWLGQNMPVGLESSLVPVVSGVSVTGMTPTSCAHVPPPHDELVVQMLPLPVPR